MRTYPKLNFFSKITWSLVIAYDAMYIFFSLLLLIGVASSTRLLMIPWMFMAMSTILCNIIFVLSVMFALGNFGSIVTFVFTSPFFAFVIYIWFAIFSTYRELGSSSTTEINTKEETRGLVSDIEVGVINPRTIIESSPSITVITNHGQSQESRVIALSGSRHSVVSSSTASLKSDTGILRGSNIQRAILGTPPPPYEIVALTKCKVEMDEEYNKDESKDTLSVSKSSCCKLTPMSSISSSSSEKASPQESIEDVISAEINSSIKQSDESSESYPSSPKELSDKEEKLL
ncbi:uncharacterized protein [Lepeophtheirus salmonis]|uniref:uncharacterized protein n=1 Tax=Lepeophtheirus salmonis TaxID=72036 RepID=UPI001AE8BB91|nr:uncharacterized protein LOC121129001 [Lepeophtheirus salmonis]XP_040580569.1 uncharacterized protein LOC121129001 [Lepeophtheirus salmonis]XP_040580571.1 uncharacterized protein LOC121129001 [Lepeophtheirus salmonis]